MANPDFVLLLERNYPGSVYGGSCHTYEKIKWTDPINPKPLEATLVAEWAVLEVQLEMEAKILELSIAAQDEITQGFESSAIGSSHWYDANLEDQLNLVGMTTAGTDSYFSVRTLKTDVQKVYMLHTAAQFHQVLEDGKLVKLVILQKFNNLKDAVLACTSVAAVQAINW